MADEYDALSLGIPLYTRQETAHALSSKFFRFGYLDVYNGLGTTKEYIFFTRPDLHLLDGESLNPEIANLPFFKELYSEYEDIIYQLQSSAKNQTSPFINIFTNTVRTALDLPSIDATDTENSATSYGESVTYRSTSIASDSNHEFSLEFDDDKYLLVYRLLKAWDEYVRLKDKGLITPPSSSYIINKELHDQVCAYKFIIDEDGETILYYAKLWGVFPKRVPRDTFSTMPTDGSLNLPVSFHAQWVEDMDPMILSDFQTLVTNYITGNVMSVFDTDNWTMNMELAHCPKIVYSDESSYTSHGQYKLLWTD